MHIPHFFENFKKIAGHILEERKPRNSSLQSQATPFAMLQRASSPAASENEFDITNSLFQDEASSDEDDFTTATSKNPEILDPNNIFDLAQDSDSDEDFIKAHQAASNRKASNVKGKSVKKGGGFQAMGTKQD